MENTIKILKDNFSYRSTFEIDLNSENDFKHTILYRKGKFNN